MNKFLKIISLGFFVCYFIEAKTQCITKNHRSENAFSLNSSAFIDNGTIPSKYTGDGENISPQLSWTNAPIGTKSFVLIVDDPDAGEKSFVHWIVFNISDKTSELPEGIQTGNFTTATTDFYYSKNGIWLYCGPFPPTGIHHYHFTLYALDAKLECTQEAEYKDIMTAMTGHVLATTKLIGFYQRKK